MQPHNLLTILPLLALTTAIPTPNLPPTNTTTTTISYGPYTLSPASMFPNTALPTTQKPCTDCYLVSMTGRLEDASTGAPLLPSSGIWLHHLMQFNLAQEDYVCPSLPGHYFYGLGNERPTWRTNSIGKWGYHVSKEDEWVNVLEIMNETPDERNVKMTVTYEWISASSADGKQYKNAELVWVNIGDACGDGEVPALPGRSEYVSEEWTSTVSGPILEARGHTHEGGESVTLFVNGVEVCRSGQSYAEREGYEVDGVARLSGAEACYDAGSVRVGDRLKIVVVYDDDEHRGLMHGGVRDDVMGVMFMYVGVGGV